MKSKLIALALFVFTATTVALFPAFQSLGGMTQAGLPPADPPVINTGVNEQSRIEVVFVLDTTGSMGGLIQAAREKIWSIATTMASAQSAPEIRMGLVAYRDRGDAYVTRVVDLSSDLDSMYAALMDFQADGGGDGPESVNQALYDAVHKLSWSQDSGTYKTVFLVGDAPPHMDYQDDVKYPVTLGVAKDKGIVINTIQCGQMGTTTPAWQQIARLGDGHYFQVEQAGSAVAIATPFDEKIARLSEKLDDTRLYYGSAEDREKQYRKMKAADKLHAASSVESRARRAAFNASRSGAANFLGEGELVDDVSSGRVDLTSIDKDQLPEPLQAMAAEEQAAIISETAARRDALQHQIDELTQERSAYLEKKVEEAGGARDSLDDKIYHAVREQAGRFGLSYAADTPAY
jgi:Mg-chelatase subunit ChlD/flagellar biosynthesis chaperone FliJ